MQLGCEPPVVCNLASQQGQEVDSHPLGWHSSSPLEALPPVCKLVQPLFAHRSLWRSASPDTFKMSHRARPGPPLTQRGSCTSGHHGKSPQSGTAALLPRIRTQRARGVEHLLGQAGCKAVLPLSCLDLSCLVLSCPV